MLSELKTHLTQPELVKEFAAEYHRELNRLKAAREGACVQRKEELARVERQIRAIIEAIKDGLRTSGMKEGLLALEARKGEAAKQCATSSRRFASCPRTASGVTAELAR